MASSRRVLFVERDESLQRLFVRLLTPAGVEVDVAGHPGEGVRLLEREKYCALVLDVTDEPVEALQMIEHLSLLLPAERPVVLAVTDPALGLRLDAEVVSLVIRKPYDIQTVIDVVGACVGAHIARFAVRNAAQERPS